MVEPKILQAADLEHVMALGRQHLQGQIQDEFEAEMASWNAPWRQEALEHYLPLGWSFGLWENQKLVAYFLAQPQLFTNGMTQSLWLEHLYFQNSDHARTLMEIAYRLCREKHFQSLLFNRAAYSEHLPSGISVQKWDEHVYHVKTAKF